MIGLALAVVATLILAAVALVARIRFPQDEGGRW